MKDPIGGMKTKKIGVLVMAYGSPDGPEDILPFYTDIRRGSPPPPALLEELTERYNTIGGTSPLLKISQAQADSIGAALGDGYKVYLGMRHWKPWIHEAVAEMQADGIEVGVGLVLAPHYSTMSIAKYIGKVEDALALKPQKPIAMKYIESWHSDATYVSILADLVIEASEKFKDGFQKSRLHLFTAHSLPIKILEAGDPYVKELEATSVLLSEKLGGVRYQFAFQSAGRTADPWLGPDLLQVLDEASKSGETEVLVCSIGFITDHLEVLYDIDVEGQAKAKELGIHLERAGSINSDDRLGELLAQRVRDLVSNV